MPMFENTRKERDNLLKRRSDFLKEAEAERAKGNAIAAKAADELLLDAEYMELMRVLAAFVKLRSPQAGDVYLILNPDGSCTFTDDKDIRFSLSARDLQILCK